MTTTSFIPLLIAIASVVTGLIVILSLVFSFSSGNDLSERLEIYALIPDATPRRDFRPMRKRMARLRTRMNSMLSAFTSEELSLRLTSANWPITETEYILIRFWGTVAGFVIGWVLFKINFARYRPGYHCFIGATDLLEHQRQSPAVEF